MIGSTGTASDTGIYGGSIRPSRITPWLVSLAVVALLLFALSQIFAPLMSRDKNIADAGDGDLIGETEVPAEESPPLIDVTVPMDEPVSVSDASIESLPLPVPTPEPDLTGDVPMTDPSSTESASAEIASPAVDAPETLKGPSDIPMPEGSVEAVADSNEPESPKPELAEKPPMKEDASLASPTVAVDGSPTELSPPLATPVPTEGASEPEPQQIAKITSTNAMVASLDGDKWIELRKGAPVYTDTVLICAPTFQAELISNDKFSTTVIGPTKFQWNLNQETQPVMSIISGKVLISAGEPQSIVSLVMAGQSIQIEFAEASHVVAIGVSHSRKPGLDPLVPENHIPVRSIIPVLGTVSIIGTGNESIAPEQSIEVGQQWTMSGKSVPTVSEIETMPKWTQPSNGADMSLEANARKGLMGLLAGGDQTLEMALREATSFRQSEVAALAGQTLLELGKGDVYFDGVGILNQRKQRAYWPDHFLALQKVVDQGVDAASDLRDSIQRMDSANGESIMRLLAGYSQQQLADGGDLELVEFLDSSSMAVRVLAIENLRRISDTTNYYRAEEENAVRREPYIKKWTARQRKGTIRWPE